MKVLDGIVSAFGKDTPVTLQAEIYQNNGRLALSLWTKPTEEDPFAEPFGTLTVNLDEPCPEDEIWVKDWSENADWALDFLFRHQIVVERPTAVVPTGYVNAKRYKLTESFQEKLLRAGFASLPR